MTGRRIVVRHTLAQASDRVRATIPGARIAVTRALFPRDSPPRFEAVAKDGTVAAGADSLDELVRATRSAP